MRTEAELKPVNIAVIEDHALTAYRKTNALLMALEGTGKQAMNAGDERVASIELGLAIRDALADVMSKCGIKSDGALLVEQRSL